MIVRAVAKLALACRSRAMSARAATAGSCALATCALVAACTRPVDDRAEAEPAIGQAALADSSVRVEGGVAAWRAEGLVRSVGAMAEIYRGGSQ